VPRHPSFLLKIKITMLDIFYISLSLPLSLSFSLSLSLSLSLYLSLTDEEGVGTLASIKHAHTLSIHLESTNVCPQMSTEVYGLSREY
jgi:hypothetical protein